ncbi:c-type cytochrome [Acetobacter sp. AN02]|uniref:c-type cytochrome n=1 Tax=Acetobacter sp. AN02 TaxID=2894186 RepID=UPI00243426A8|nr:c-type cytochrome [Acetobacter sp. AN02]MDG6095320.1 c-type cytochrome [Acetobacter sp. AN02]
MPGSKTQPLNTIPLPVHKPHRLRHAALLLIPLALTACSGKKDGHHLYATNCGICHHGGGGQKGEVPPLTGRLGIIAATKEGRAYLAAVLMNGLGGPITANGEPYSAGMPPFRYLDDETVAKILTWLAAQDTQGTPPVITPAEIAKARARPVSSGDVALMRENLNRQHPIP